MAVKPSSTSSSKPRAGAPWGLLTAAVLVLVLELVLRLLNPTGAVARYSAGHEFAYRAVPFEIQQGVGDVVIVGSSRARRGVLAPLLREALEKRGLPSSVKNFSLNAAQAEELELVVRQLVEAQPRPKLLVWAITARELEERERRPSSYVRYLARPTHWVSARREGRAGVDGYLPEAIRNEAARWSYVARSRFAVRHLLSGRGTEDDEDQVVESLAGAFVPTSAAPTPMQGAMPSSALSSKRNASRKVSSARIKKYLGDAYTQRNWPHNYQAEHLESAVREARRLGVPVLLVEIPVSDQLEKQMPRGTQKKFRRYLAEVGRRHQVPFVPVQDLAASFEPRDFLEYSHLNYRGSVKYTEALAPLVIQGLEAQAKRR